MHFFCLLFFFVALIAMRPALAQDSNPPPPAQADAPAVPTAAAPGIAPAPATAQPEAPAQAPAAATPQKVQQLTLMVMIQQGGFILWIIMGLGFIGTVWAIYLLATVTARREVPPNLAKRAQAQVRGGDIRGAYQ